MNLTHPVTQGVNHIGLTVAKLEESAGFFTQVLGWSEVNRNPDYPAIFVSDGQIMLTLWDIKTDKPNAFNKNDNVGLHHLALSVADLETLDKIHSRLKEYDIEIEFVPEFVGQGPSKHMFCFDPSGIRIEFIYNAK